MRTAGLLCSYLHSSSSYAPSRHHYYLRRAILFIQVLAVFSTCRLSLATSVILATEGRRGIKCQEQSRQASNVMIQTMHWDIFPWPQHNSMEHRSLSRSRNSQPYMNSEGSWRTFSCAIRFQYNEVRNGKPILIKTWRNSSHSLW
jgi:hypothetical protein